MPLYSEQTELRARAERERRRRIAQRQAETPQNAEGWIRALFPKHFPESVPFAPHHTQFWDWVWNVQPDVRPKPMISILARGGGKTTMAEGATVALGARKIDGQHVREYAWYVRATQDQADQNIENIREMVESSAVAHYYPDFSNPKVGRHGRRNAWRRARLWTRSGFVVDAIGLDTAVRGSKSLERRPDLIILDDIDEKHDSPARTKKKIEVITTSLLPAGSSDVAIIGLQNLIISGGFFYRLGHGTADYLADAIVSGPHPALIGFKFEDRGIEAEEGRRYIIVSGIPTWEGQDVEVCQNILNNSGPTAFRQECQHEVDIFEGGLYSTITFERVAPTAVPDLELVAVAVDPSVTATDGSDNQAIQVDGLGSDGRLYRLWSWEGIDTPESCLELAIVQGLRHGARVIGIEANQGGTTWRSVYKQACQNLGYKRSEVPYVKLYVATSAMGSKANRQSMMVPDYELGKIFHVMGTHHILETALQRFGHTKPWDLSDAAFWGWHYLHKRLRSKAQSASKASFNRGRVQPSGTIPQRTEERILELLQHYEMLNE